MSTIRNGLRLAIVAAAFAPITLVAQQRGAPPPATQQQQQQQQLTQQQRMQQMDQSLRQMEQVRDRLHQMEQNLTRQMEQTSDQERLREQQQLRDLCLGLGQTADQVRSATLQLRDMDRMQTGERDQEMQRDMDRLRQHLHDIGTQLQEGLQVMERLQERLRTSR